MARPLKCRCVAERPQSDYFKPRGIPLNILEEVTLTLDEAESLRLAHVEDLYQEEACARMKVSRQTFGNILNSAHKKISGAIINGKALKIEGGVCDIGNYKKSKEKKRRKGQ
ncbi:MAG: DUF134 domain-containing protein [Candidatus Omnitrophota bacterium]